jgi:NAD(P)-dependent dehydrogenase (short-subunit alcohol dehydrogenase family)
MENELQTGAAAIAAPQLEGKVAVVTGAAKGIGRAIAEAFAAQGATVVVSDLDAAGARAAADAIDRAHAVACDVRDEQQVASLIDAVVERHGRIDVAVANAGIAAVRPIAETSLEDWRRVTSVHLDGVFLTVKHAGLAIAAAGGGSIVTIASVTGFAGTPLNAPYAASNAAVINLTKTAALELRPAGVRVNAICPGFVATDMVSDQKEAFAAGLGVDSVDPIIERAQGRYGTARDVAGVALFLASDRSRFSTGAAFVVDGGLTASLF